MNILATWICLDDENNASYFPSTKGLSSDLKIQTIYWKCLLSSMYTARYFNPNIRLVVFSNAENLPIIGGVDFENIFQILNIEFHKTAFKFQTPEGYYGQWRNQFYEFSIFDYIANSNQFDSNDNFCLIDSDCVLTKSLDSLFMQVASLGVINYNYEYHENYKINGLSRLDMKSVFERLANEHLEKIPNYYAGEFFAARVEKIQSINNEFQSIWPKLLDFHQKRELVLNEEAHVLSYIFFKLGFENEVGNSYIKRLWTDPTTFRNICKEDELLAIWHLPAEKRTGFNTFFKLLKELQFSVQGIKNDELILRMKKIFSIPSLTLKKITFYKLKGLFKILLRK
jgi:hypothetical protein